MKPMSLRAAAVAVLVVGASMVASDSVVFAQKGDVSEKAQPRSDRYVPLPPHQQPREADAPDNGIKPSAKEKAVDRKINNICRGC
jgi:hypothetical protein